MPEPLERAFTLSDLRLARQEGRRVPMLTCYDYTTARLMHQAGVPALLVGDSAANILLGHGSTLPVSLDFMIEITAAVRRGAPHALLLADMPFGSYQSSISQGAANTFRMIQKSGCDLVKLEVAASHAPLVSRLADAGVAVVAHLGLRPQTVNLLGSYKARGRNAAEAMEIVALALQMEQSGATAILLEAVPPEVSQAVIAKTGLPVIGCGAGAACHSSVIVTHDALGLTPHRPRFVPELDNVASVITKAVGQYCEIVADGSYPRAGQQYEMIPEEKAVFEQWLENMPLL